MPVSKVSSKIIFTAIALSSVFSLNSAYSAIHAAPAGKAAPKASGKPAVNNSAALTGYWNRLRTRLQSNWQVPDGKNNVVLTANIASDGTSADMAAVGHPKDAQAEVSAVEAFNKSLPLEALPAGVSAAKLTVNFEYSYDPHGDGFSRVSGQISQTAAPAAPAASAAAGQPAADGTPTEGAKF